MWIAIGVGAPVLLLSLAVAFWPVMSHTYRYHRWEHRRGERRHRPLPERRMRTGCALCAATFEAPSGAEAVAAKNAHVMRAHGQSGSEAVPETAPERTTATEGAGRMVVTRGA